MRNRRKSRELALQALYFMDSRRNFSREALKLFCRCFQEEDQEHSFFEEITLGVMTYRRQIDRQIERFSSHWKISRMSCVDRNIMRVAVYEMLFREDIPAKVSINEAIDIGKKFGTEESGAFINGILDSIHLAVDRGEITADPNEQTEIPLHSPAERGYQPVRPEEAEAYFSPVKGRPGVVKRRAQSEPPSADTEKTKQGAK
ncbi:MAG: transcription antitermination factor NusB [Thermodesulfobacteriota bacterium]